MGDSDTADERRRTTIDGQGSKAKNRWTISGFYLAPVFLITKHILGNEDLTIFPFLKL